MQFKFVWLPLVILAGVSSVYGSALDIVQARDLAIASDLTIRDDVQCNWCGLCSYTSPVGPGLNHPLIRLLHGIGGRRRCMRRCDPRRWMQ
jgi:hypothetical protein